MQVRDIMRPDVVRLKRSDAATVADEVMRLVRIHYLPVTDEASGKLVGIVSHRDLLRSALYPCWRGGKSEGPSELMKNLEIGEVMSPEVVSTTPETPVAHAATMMRDRGVGCLPVLDSGKLVGIVTEAEFVKLVSRFQGEETANWVL